MFKGTSRFKSYLGSTVILFAALTVVGCAKKVSPVVGSEGISGGEKSSSSASSAQGSSEQSGSVQGDANKGMGSDGRSQDMAKGMNPAEKAEQERVAKKKAEQERVAKKRAEEESVAKAARGMNESGPRFAENVYFDFDKWTIRGDARDMLTENARWLVANVGTQINIEGHGDERGTNEYNLALGERRARSTKRYLMNLGVSSSRISFISYGEEKSVCGERTEGCFQKNRRAHFVVK